MPLFMRLLKRYRIFLLFLLLELVALRMHYRSANYLAGRAFKVSSHFIGQLHVLHLHTTAYFSLRDIHAQLLAENLLLRKRINHLQQQLPEEIVAHHTPLTADSGQYKLIPAQVIQNSYTRIHNTITLNKGAMHGLKAGMGLLGPTGIVGRIRYVSKHFATAYSLLDVDMLVSTQLGKNGILCSTRWTAESTHHAQLQYLPRHIQPYKGDTVYTSGYDGIYPAKLPIGVLEDIQLAQHDTFYRINIRLLTDFHALYQVYALDLPRQAEKEALQRRMNLTAP